MTEESKALILAPEFAMAPEKIKARIEELKAFVKAYMVEGEDYGTIPGTAKPTLYKSGAEKLCDVYGFQRLFPIMSQVEDWDRGLFHYVVRADLVDPRIGLVVAQGLGSANTMEARYRWRYVSRTCSSCGEEAIIKGKAEYGGGWVCFKKKGGCGSTFSDDDPRIVEQPIGRVENDDPYTLANTILKMAKKRALVDAVLSATRSSGLFTQDMEDMSPTIEGEVIRPNPEPSGQKAEAPPKSRQSGSQEDADRDALFGQAAKMWPERDPHTAICQALNLPEIREGALHDHWLAKGGTYKEAQAYLAEVRRREVQGKMLLVQAQEEVNAYGQLLAARPVSEPDTAPPMRGARAGSMEI